MEEEKVQKVQVDEINDLDEDKQYEHLEEIKQLEHVDEHVGENK